MNDILMNNTEMPGPVYFNNDDDAFDTTPNGFRRFVTFGSSRPAFNAACVNSTQDFMEPMDSYLMAVYEAKDGSDTKLKPYCKIAVKVFDCDSARNLLPHPLLSLKILAALGAHQDAMSVVDTSENFLNFVGFHTGHRWLDELGRQKRKCFSSGFCRSVLVWYTAPKLKHSIEEKNMSKEFKGAASAKDMVTKIADLFANKKVKGWRHIDVLRIAHIPATYKTSVGAFVNSQFEKHLADAIEKFEMTIKEAEGNVPENGEGELNEKHYIQSCENRAVLQFMKALNTVITSNDPVEIASTINLNPELGLKHVPTKWLHNPEVAFSLLHRMDLKELLSMLQSYSSRGILKEDAPESAHIKLVLERLNEESVKKSGIQPPQILKSQQDYIRGNWSVAKKLVAKNELSVVPQPISGIVCALSGALESSFKNVTKTINKKVVIGLDLRQEMACGSCAGCEGLPPLYLATFLTKVLHHGATVEQLPEVVTFRQANSTSTVSKVKVDHEGPIASLIDQILKIGDNAAKPDPVQLLQYGTKKEANTVILFTDTPDLMSFSNTFDTLKTILEDRSSKTRGPVRQESVTILLQDRVKILSTSHRAALKKSFDAMMNKKRNAEIFVRLFQDYPQYKGIFPQFKYLNDEALLTTGGLAMHEDVYMGGLEKIITSLDSDVLLADQVKKISASHKRKGVTKAHVLNMIPIIIHVATAVNGGAIDEETEKAWTAIFELIADVVESYKFEK